MGQALQTIGNLGLQLGQGKEPWMAPLNAVLLPSVTRVCAFLDTLVTVDSPEGDWGQRAGRGHGCCRVSGITQLLPGAPSGCGGIWGDTAPSLPAVGEVPVPRGHSQPSATIKEGPLHTCPEEGVALLPRFAFKKRHFRLSTRALACAKTPGGQVGAAPHPHPKPGAQKWGEGCGHIFGGVWGYPGIHCIPVEGVGDVDIGTFLRYLGFPKVSMDMGNGYGHRHIFWDVWDSLGFE